MPKRKVKAKPVHRRPVHHVSRSRGMSPVIQFGVVFFMVAAFLTFAAAVKMYWP